jgi:hypothetical protein
VADGDCFDEERHISLDRTTNLYRASEGPGGLTGFAVECSTSETETDQKPVSLRGLSGDGSEREENGQPECLLSHWTRSLLSSGYLVRRTPWRRR